MESVSIGGLKKLPWRLAAVDLDGTLLGPDQRISTQNRMAIEQLDEAGIEVVIATGRHFSATQPFALQLPKVEWLVSSQGAEVSSVDRSTVLQRIFMLDESLKALVEYCSRYSVTAMFYGEDGVVTSSTPNEATRFYENLTELPVPQIGLDDLSRLSVFKVVLNGEPEAISAMSYDEVLNLPGMQQIRTHGRLLEIMPEHIGKSSGLARLAETLGLEAEEVVAFGDAENDISMFEWSGASVAMAHGWPRAKEAAQSVSPGGDERTAFARSVEALLQLNSISVSSVA